MGIYAPRAHCVPFWDKPPENCPTHGPPQRDTPGAVGDACGGPWRMPPGSHGRGIVHDGRQCRMCKDVYMGCDICPGPTFRSPKTDATDVCPRKQGAKRVGRSVEEPSNTHRARTASSTPPSCGKSHGHCAVTESGCTQKWYMPNYTTAVLAPSAARLGRKVQCAEQILLSGTWCAADSARHWEAGFSFPGGGGGSIEPSGRTPPSSLKKGSTDRTPEILPRLTPGPRR